MDADAWDRRVAMKKIIVWIVLVLCLIGIVIGVRKWRLSRASAQPAFEEVAVQRRDIKAQILATAEVRPQNRVAVKSPIAGRVEDVLVREGTNVVKGQLLAWVSSSERAALMDAARARGPEELAHWEQLYRPSPLVAPLDGQIINRKVEPGQTVSGADELLILSDRLIVAAQVDETDLAHIKKGQQVEIKLDAFPDATLAGKVDHIAYEAITVNNVTMYKIEVLPDQTPPFLRSGMTANVAFIVAAATNVLAVPLDAVRGDDRGTWVLRRPRAGNNGVITNALNVGLSDGRWIEVESGLQEGDRVLKQDFRLSATAGSSGKNPFMPFSRRPSAGGGRPGRTGGPGRPAGPGGPGGPGGP